MAGGYQIPEKMVQADVAKFKRLDYSVGVMARIGREEKADSRLSLDCVAAVIGFDNP